MECKNCGKPLQEDFNVCPYCGTVQKIICRKCGEELEEDFINCPYCGEPVIKVSMADRLKESTAALSDKVAPILKKTGEAARKTGEAAGKGLADLTERVKTGAKKGAERVRQIDFEEKAGAVKSGASGVFSRIKKLWGHVLDFIGRLAEKVQNFLKERFGEKIGPFNTRTAALILMILAAIIVLLVVIGIASLFRGEGGEPTAAEMPAATTGPDAALPAVDPSEQTWLVMLYADADDEMLEEDMLFDINEMELTGSSERVQIVAQIDRFNGGYSGDGNWSDARRYFITQDSDLSVINSPVVEELGEINMGDPKTLIDFVTWSVDTYPSDRYVLILSDHGGGWTGGWTDPDPSYDYLTLEEMDYAFSQLVFNLPNKKFDIIGFDACLMSQLDVYSAIAPYARFSIASEEVEPATGWAYSAFLQELVYNPAMDPRELASIVVETYLEQDQRFLNNEARASLFQGDTNVSVQEALDLVMPNSTLTAVDLAYIPKSNELMNDFAYYMTTIDQTSVAAARNYAPSFTSVFGEGTPPSFIDLFSFSLILEQEMGDGFDPTSGAQLRDSLKEAIIINKAGKEKTGAQGISIYFPNSSMYTNEYGGYQVYTSQNSRFMEDSRWDDFLAYHYAGVSFNPDSQIAVIPSRAADVAGPGAGQIQVGEIVLSTNIVSPGDILSFNTEITGTNVGNVYMQYGWLAKDVRTMLVVLGMDFIRSDQTREMAGVYYPDWGTSGRIPISYEFEPMLAFIADEFEENISFVEAVVSKYGATEDDILITVPGIFTFEKSGRELYAEMNFNNTGDMTNIIGYSGQIEVVDIGSEFEGLFQISYPGEEGAGDPYTITPSAGDTFMPFFTGYIIEDDIYLNVKSDPITFNRTPINLVAAPVTEFDIDFPYYIAVVVEDLDGNLTDAVTLDTFTIKR